MSNQPRKTMSVLEMGRLLGLKKVESYWLVHKEYFTTILVNGKMRVVIDSFERWYKNQVKYHKITGEPPGEELKQKSYAARDIAEMLGICEQYAYEVMKAAGIDPFIIDDWQRYPREDFERWYSGQTHFRNARDRLRDAEAEANSMSMPDMARLLDVSRSTVYNIINSESGKQLLEIVVIADRKRITKESFDRWYRSQQDYFKPEDQPPEVSRKYQTYAASLMKKKIRVKKKVRKVRISTNLDYLTPDEAAILAEVSIDRVYHWIKENKFPVLRVSKMVTRIPRKEFEAFLQRHRKGGKK